MMPTTLCVANQCAMDLAKIGNVNRQTKNIGIRYRFTKQALTDRVVQLQYCPTDGMVADILTNPLRRVKHEKFRVMCSLKTDKRFKNVTEGE